MADEKAKPKEAQRGFNDKGERVVVEIAALRKEFGNEEGDRKYRALSTLMGGGTGSGIVTPLAGHEPDLSLVGITPAMVAQAEAILASKGE